MDILTEAYKGLFPNKEPKQEMKLKYSCRFSDYNANVRYTKSVMEFHLSRRWKDVDRDIKMGLLQSLMQKVFRREAAVPKTTSNIDMYNIFIKKLHATIPVTQDEPELRQSFNRINERFFSGIIEGTNLKWGSEEATNKFGSYSYAQDLVTISPSLKGRAELIDYVMYHELLHKKLKFRHGRVNSRHHTKEFRALEKSYPGYERLEDELKDVSRKKRFHKKSIKLFNWVGL